MLSVIVLLVIAFIAFGYIIFSLLKIKELKRSVSVEQKAVRQQTVLNDISTMLAACPDDADEKGELIDKADKALYFAKRTGKNKVAVFREKAA